MRPRGLPSSWLIVTRTYGCDKIQPSRQRERQAWMKAEETPPQPCEGCGTLTLDWRDNGWFCTDECVQLWIDILLDQPEFRDADEHRKARELSIPSGD